MTPGERLYAAIREAFGFETPWGMLTADRKATYEQAAAILRDATDGEG